MRSRLMTPEQATRQAFARMMNRVKAAGRDVDAFCEYIGEGPGGRRLRQDQLHREWQQFWDQHQFSVLLAPVGTGKTTQLRHRLLHMVGRNPNLQVAYISATERHPKKVFRGIGSEIERNPRVQNVFPTLKPGRVWSSTELEVVRTSREPDPTFQLFGAFTQSVLGTRADIVVFDDLCNDSNTLTEYNRDRMAEWVGEVISRLKPGARVMAIGHIWHEHDQLQRWARLPGWGYRRDEATYVDEDGIERSIAPSVLTLDDIALKAANLGPVMAEMMLWNRLPNRELGRFRQSWFDRCLELGRGLSFAESWHGGMTYTGVDLGHRKTPGHDLTVLLTAAVLPEGTRQILDIRSGLWKSPEIRREIEDVHRRYGSIIAVETNGAQNYLLDEMEELNCLPVTPHETTPANKHHVAHGVEALGRELAQGRWMMPCDDQMIPWPEMQKAINACLSYDPTRHTPDHLMAWWICKEAIRLSPAAAGVEIEHVDNLLSR